MDLAAGAGCIRRLTNVPQTRFADFAWDGSRSRLIAVGETHGAGHGALPRNALWTIPAGDAGEAPAPLLEGHDFYASPRISCQMAAGLPSLPGIFLRCLGMRPGFSSRSWRTDGHACEPSAVAGGDGSACIQPEWIEDGTLFFVWDVGGCGATMDLARRFKAREGRRYRWRSFDAAMELQHRDLRPASRGQGLLHIRQERRGGRRNRMRSARTAWRRARPGSAPYMRFPPPERVWSSKA